MLFSSPWRSLRFSLSAALLILVFAFVSGAATRTWVGPREGNWFVATNWSPNDAWPQEGDDVRVTNGAVVLSNATATLSSFLITNATLIFTNWNTCLRATDVTLQNNGLLTHCTNSANAAVLGQWIPDNRVWIVCTNLTVNRGAFINVLGRGYRGGDNVSNIGRGPGGGTVANFGAGHGGWGGKYWWGTSFVGIGVPYGNAGAPAEPGSGGGGSAAGHQAYAGGGVIRIEAADAVVVNGTLNANGFGSAGHSYAGAGSGGSLYITCRTFHGTNGLLSVDGGEAGALWGYSGGGGAGGRMAIAYDPIAQSNLNLAVGKPTVQLWANPGQLNVLPGQPGTIHLPDDQILPPVIRGGQFVNLSSWSTPGLMVSNGWAILSNTTLNVAGDLTAWGPYGKLVWTNSAEFRVGGNLLVTNTASLWVHGLPTNEAADHATRVTVGGALTIGPGSGLYPASDPTNGGSVLFRAASLLVTTGAVVDATGRGLYGGTTTNGFGNGRGQYNVSAAGYGGKGSGWATVAGTNYGWTYGSATAPVDAGSGGGGAGGGAGGGLVRMEITNTATVAGSILANGIGGTRGGSGGAIHLMAAGFSLGSGTLRAAGGTGSAKGGGGGRISLTGASYDSGDGVLNTAAGGAGAETGTVHRGAVSGDWFLFVEGTPARYGSSAPFDYGQNGFTTAALVTNTVTELAAGAPGVRYACHRWTLASDQGPVAEGIPPQAVFTADTNLTLTWHWTNQFLLSVRAINGGYLDPDRSGWYTNGLAVTVQALASNGYEFLQWIGPGVPAGQRQANPLTLAMDQPRDLTAVFVLSGGTGIRTWNGTANWYTPASWSPAGIPGPGETAVLRTGSALLYDPATVQNLVISNTATLVSSNWNTTLTATNILVYGLITHGQNSAWTTNAAGQWIPDAGVFLECAHFTLATNARILADGKGYQGGIVGDRAGRGPGGGKFGVTRAGGGSYGGRGGKGNDATYSDVYGLAELPAEPGSGGGSKVDGNSASHGGGFVSILASEHMLINGAISANGLVSANDSGGGGSGGGIRLACRTFAGTNGLISATGGNSTGWGGGGGGGRIALAFDPAAMAAAGLSHSVRISARNGLGGGYADAGELGTVHLTDSGILSPVLPEWSGRGLFAQTNGWTGDSLTLSNGWWVFPTNFTLAVSNTLSVIVSGRLDAVESRIDCGSLTIASSGTVYAYRGTASVERLAVAGDLVVSNAFLHYWFAENDPESLAIGGNLILTNARCWFYSGVTNSFGPDHGGLLNLAGRDLHVPTNSVLYPVAHPTNGASLLMRFRNLTVGDGGWINGDTNGFWGGITNHGAGFGPGGGLSNVRGGGGGHGGKGGNGSDAVGGTNNGVAMAPRLPGSGGGAKNLGAGNPGGSGGSLVRIEASGTVRVNGTISANGAPFPAGSDSSGGGAGGGIHITCKRIEGSAGGRMTANGGAGSGSLGGGGGGGRVAVWTMISNYTGQVTVNGGAGFQAGGAGTVYWKALPPGGAVIVVR